MGFGFGLRPGLGVGVNGRVEWKGTYMGPRNTLYDERTERKVEALLRSCQGLTTMEKRAVMYAPRRMLMNLGNVAARSKPPDSAFPGTLIPHWLTTSAAPAKNAAARDREPPVSMIADRRLGKFQRGSPYLCSVAAVTRIPVTALNIQ